MSLPSSLWLFTDTCEERLRLSWNLSKLQVPGSWGILHFPLTMATPTNTTQIPQSIYY